MNDSPVIVERSASPGSAAIPFRFAALAAAVGCAMLHAADAPELFLSLQGIAVETIEQGEPLRVTVRIEAPETFTGAWVLAPTSGTWADAVAVEIVPEGRTDAAASGVVVGRPDQPHATIDRDRIAGGLWRFAPEAMQRLAPGSYRVRAKLTVHDGSGWKGAAESEELPLTVIAPSNAPERAGLKSMALARDAFLVGETEKTAKLLDAEMSRDPQNFRLLLLRAAVAERVGNFPAAQFFLNMARRSVGEISEGYPNVELEELSGRVVAGLLRPADDAAREDPPAWSWPPANMLKSIPTILEDRGTASAAGIWTSPSSMTASATTASPPSAVGESARALPAGTASTVPSATAPADDAPPPSAPSHVRHGVVPASELSDSKILGDAMGQWAASARAGSEYGPVQGSAARATGAPDVPGADDHPNAWCPATRDSGADWLEVAFAKPVRASEVRVRQNNGPGAIVKVEAIEPNGATHVWWEGVDPYGQEGTAREAVWFAVRVPPTGYPVAKIKLTLDLGVHPRWKQVDAVQLVEAGPTASEIMPSNVPAPAEVTPYVAPTASPAPAPGASATVPAPPASPLNNLVRKLAEKRGADATASKPREEDLFKPEFRFRRSAEWLVLPALARQLSTNDSERIAVLDLMVQGVTETSRLLAAEGADNDIAAATAIYFTQLWSVARQREVSEAGADALHAQIVSALAGSEVAAMSDADKQRYWEYCLGLPIFVIGMLEVATEPSAQADLRTIAAAGFEVLLGVRPELVEIGPDGLKAGETLTLPQTTAPATSGPAPQPPVAVAGGVPREVGLVTAVSYAAPAGWSREDANWATIFRATLGDLDHQGRPDVNSDRKHQASIFVLPPRAAPQGPAALFEPLWRQEFGTFELGDAVVHYRSRLKCGLVVYFMGRFFNRPGQDNRENQTYAVLYLIDLGERVQPITATLVPGKSMYSMTSMNENEGLRALSGPLGAFLDSIEPAGGVAPYPSGGLFAAAEIRGNWVVSRSAFGGMYVYTATGLGAGAAVAGSSNAVDLRDDGTFAYRFSGYVQNPGMSGQLSSDNNDGRYTLEGDIVRFTPRLPRSYRYDRCAVGAGTVRTPDGPHRILALVGANSSGVFRGPPLIPVGGNYDGLMDWFVEEPRAR